MILYEQLVNHNSLEKKGRPCVCVLGGVRVDNDVSIKRNKELVGYLSVFSQVCQAQTFIS